jgi:hypothetical protein
MIELETCVATQSWVNREYRRRLSTHPCGAPVLRINLAKVLLTTFTPSYLGLTRQELQDPVTQGGVQTQGSDLSDELGGLYGAEGRAIVNIQHSYICIPLVQMGCSAPTIDLLKRYANCSGSSALGKLEVILN